MNSSGLSLSYIIKGSIDIGKYEDQAVFDLAPEHFMFLLGN